MPRTTSCCCLTSARVGALRVAALRPAEGWAPTGVLQVTTAGAAQAVGVLDSLPEVSRDRLVHGLPQRRRVGSRCAAVCECSRTTCVPVAWRLRRVRRGHWRTRPVTCHHEAAYADVSIDIGKANRLGAGRLLLVLAGGF